MNGEYGLVNLYCSWEIDIPSDKKIEVKLINFSTNYFSKSILVVESIDQQGKTSYYTLNFRNFDWNQFKNMKTLNIHFSTQVSFATKPFEFYIYNEEITKTNITLLVTVTVIPGVVILVCLILFLCVKNGHRNIPQQNVIVSNQESPLQEVKRKNQAILKELLQTVLKPILFDEKINKYKSPCTICLEEFTLNSEVISLECKHLFHYGCLKNWLTKNILSPKCPNCNDNSSFHLHLLINSAMVHNRTALSSAVNPSSIQHLNIPRPDSGEDLEVSHLNIGNNDSNNLPVSRHNRVRENDNRVIHIQNRRLEIPINNNYIETSNRLQLNLNRSIESSHSRENEV